jgi:ATP-dependent exoDNAse (exonuclease V) beta subunit
LGTAFHLLAQQAIERSSAIESLDALPEPSDEDIHAKVKHFHLDDLAERRLRRALARWFASDCAEVFASHASRAAEVLFMVRIERDGAATFLEGEIDGLATNGDEAAYLIDYKTGGRPDESAEELQAKHELQATCYAYALFEAGYERVVARFVRVEQDDPVCPGQPQIVEYRFAASERDALRERILAHVPSKGE